MDINTSPNLTPNYDTSTNVCNDNLITEKIQYFAECSCFDTLIIQELWETDLLKEENKLSNFFIGKPLKFSWFLLRFSLNCKIVGNPDPIKKFLTPILHHVVSCAWLWECFSEYCFRKFIIKLILGILNMDFEFRIMVVGKISIIRKSA